MAEIQETKLWEWCKTHGDYTGYLMQYPNGQYALEAKMLINGDGIKEYSNNNIENEKTEFNNCKLITEFLAFIKKYPYGEYSTLAKDIIQTKTSYKASALLLSITGKEEDFDFEHCHEKNEYERFLSTYPKGKHKTQAEKRINALTKEPSQLILLFICNILGIASLIIGLSINKIILSGLVLLGLGLFELFAHFKLPFMLHALTTGDNYLQLSGYLSVIGGIIFLLM